MKNLARCSMLFCIIGLSNTIFAQEWIPYQQNTQVLVEQRTIVEPVRYYQPVVYYQPVPYVIQQNMIVEKQCLFHRTQTVITRPVTYWIYQPVILYR